MPRRRTDTQTFCIIRKYVSLKQHTHTPPLWRCVLVTMLTGSNDIMQSGMENCTRDQYYHHGIIYLHLHTIETTKCYHNKEEDMLLLVRRKPNDTNGKYHWKQMASRTCPWFIRRYFIPATRFVAKWSLMDELKQCGLHGNVCALCAMAKPGWGFMRVCM